MLPSAMKFDLSTYTLLLDLRRWKSDLSDERKAVRFHSDRRVISAFNRLP